ncbi:17362_t:CDS:2 [Funneliformis geosporum]|nr:17362_t:CDS:2 [Funneliformis geosporum]
MKGDKKNEKTKVLQSKEDPEADPDPITQTYEEETPTLEAFNRVEDIYFKECSVGRDLERSHKNRSLMSK